MKKQVIVNAFRESISSNKEISMSIFGTESVPEKIENTILTISSINFADLIIDIENRLGIEIKEDCMISPRISIGDLVEKVEKYV